ncbi:MAG: hypothetical protein NVS2B4_03420 [Ramlibacter sp.]
MLARDPAAADPVCPKSPQHGLVLDAVRRADTGEAPAKPLVFRDPKASRRFSVAGDVGSLPCRKSA